MQPDAGFAPLTNVTRSNSQATQHGRLTIARSSCANSPISLTLHRSKNQPTQAPHLPDSQTGKTVAKESGTRQAHRGCPPKKAPFEMPHDTSNHYGDKWAQTAMPIRLGTASTPTLGQRAQTPPNPSRQMPQVFVRSHRRLDTLY